MKTILLNILAALLVAALFTACEKDDDSKPLLGKPQILLSTTVGESSYYGTIKDLSVQSTTNDNSYEHANRAASFIYKDMVFILEHHSSDKVFKYKRTDSNILEKVGVLTLPAGSAGSCLVFKDENKAYIGLDKQGAVYAFNPTTLKHIKTIDLTDYAVKDGNPDPCELMLRNDGKLFVCLRQNITMFTCHDKGYVAVIDSKTDKVEKVITDTRVTGLGGSFNRSIFIDENDDIYMYSTGGFGKQPGAKDGFLRIKKGETEFDANYYFSPQNTAVADIKGGQVSYGMSFYYGGNGKLYSMMLVPGLAGNTHNYEKDKSAQPVVLDIHAKTVTKLNLPPSNMYASVGITRLNNEIIFGMSTINGDGLYTYNVKTGEAHEQPVVKTVGKPQFLNVFGH